MGQRLGRGQQVLLEGLAEHKPSSPSARRSNDTWDDSPAGRRPKPRGELRNYLGGLAKDSEVLTLVRTLSSPAAGKVALGFGTRDLEAVLGVMLDSMKQRRSPGATSQRPMAPDPDEHGAGWV